MSVHQLTGTTALRATRPAPPTTQRTQTLHTITVASVIRRVHATQMELALSPATRGRHRLRLTLAALVLQLTIQVMGASPTKVPPITQPVVQEDTRAPGQDLQELGVTDRRKQELVRKM